MFIVRVRVIVMVRVSKGQSNSKVRVIVMVRVSNRVVGTSSYSAFICIDCSASWSLIQT